MKSQGGTSVSIKQRGKYDHTTYFFQTPPGERSSKEGSVESGKAMGHYTQKKIRRWAE